MKNVKIAPSIFAADFVNLKKVIDDIERLKVDYIHYDIMDYHFVPNISFGPLITEQIAKATSIPGDVHLMIELSPGKVERFFIDNVQIITVHVEAGGFSRDILNLIKESGRKVGISIKPGTHPDVIIPYLDLVDLVLVMTVEPGFSGQSLIPGTEEKVKKVREMLSQVSRDVEIEVDGGVNIENMWRLIENGASILVMGSFFFRDGNAEKVVNTLRMSYRKDT